MYTAARLYLGMPTVTLGGSTEVKMVQAIPTSGFPPALADGWPGRRRAGPGLYAATTWSLMGPDFIQIGTEGGFLPQAVDLPTQPVDYVYDRRNIVVLNVGDKDLFLGPAERADVIVDFSAFAGKTIILYNDSPAPVPAGDPRLDYYTGNPDYSLNGGAPQVMPKQGPNTRTIMQFKVSNYPGPSV